MGNACWVQSSLRTPGKCEICTFMHIINCFPSKLLRRKLRTKQLRATLGLCLRKTRAGKSHDYDAPFSKCVSSSLKRIASTVKFHGLRSVFESSVFLTGPARQTVRVTVRLKQCIFFFISRRSGYRT